MAKVGIVMGSDSDMPVMSKAADVLEELGIDYEMRIISAHREPDVFFEYAKTAEEKGMKVLLVNGGAHPKGCTNRALEEVEKALKEEEIETLIYHIPNVPLQDCICLENLVTK